MWLVEPTGTEVMSKVIAQLAAAISDFHLMFDRTALQQKLSYIKLQLLPIKFLVISNKCDKYLEFRNCSTEILDTN